MTPKFVEGPVLRNRAKPALPPHQTCLPEAENHSVRQIRSLRDFQVLFHDDGLVRAKDQTLVRIESPSYRLRPSRSRMWQPRPLPPPHSSQWLVDRAEALGESCRSSFADCFAWIRPRRGYTKLMHLRVLAEQLLQTLARRP